MSIDPNVAVEGAVGAITAIGGIYTGFRHILSNYKKKREKYRQSILEEAKLEVERVRQDLENKIKEVELELNVQRENVAREMDHLKETYNTEIRILGQRVEELRQDLTLQHGSLMALLTKLVGPN